MLERRRGDVVFVSSEAAVLPRTYQVAYSACKAGVEQVAKVLQMELEGTGVRANSVLPSIINTASNRAAMPDADHAAWPTPEDIARVILFLCSDDARLVNGAAIAV